MENFELCYFGCIIIVDGVPNLYIRSNMILLEGMPLIVDENNLYVYLEENEMVIVGLRIVDEIGIEINADDLTDSNITQFEYKISPIHVYKLKTIGLTFDDVLDFKILDMLFNKVLYEYLNNEK